MNNNKIPEYFCVKTKKGTMQRVHIRRDGEDRAWCHKDVRFSDSFPPPEDPLKRQIMLCQRCVSFRRGDALVRNNQSPIEAMR